MKPLTSYRPPRLTVWDKLKLWRITQDPTMKAKLQSRKLWVTVVTAALTALSGQLGLDPELVTKLVAMASAYVIGQGLADRAG